MNNEKSIAPRFLNILEHYMTIVERENDELKERVKICKENHIRYDIKAIDDNTELRAEIDILKEENNELKAECWCGCNDDLKAEYEELKALVDDLKKDKAIESLNDALKTKQKEHLRSAKSRIDMIKVYKGENEDLRAEIKQLRADMTHDSDVCYDLDDKHVEEIKRLNAELVAKDKQYHMMASSKEYKAEADEYFDNNPQAKEVYFYMLSDYDMKDAESGDLMLSQDDAICSVTNLKEGSK